MKILKFISKLFLYSIGIIILFFTLKLLIPLDRKSLDYPNKGRWQNHQRNEFISAEECGICHQDIYQQWKESGMANATKSSLLEFDLHRLALSFRGYPEEDVQWCYQCHAPLALTKPLDLNLEDSASKSGVTCMVCHTSVHAIPDSNAGNLFINPIMEMNGPFDDVISHFHKSQKHELFEIDNSDLCASCHYSVYPRNNMPIDWTWKEWHEVEKDKQSCQECHMPEYVGKSADRDWVPKRKLRKHTFPGGGKYNPDFIKTAVSLFANYNDALGIIDIKITNNCGHNFPTGNGSAPALELRITSNDKEIYSELFRNSYIGHFGFEVMDPTLAIKKGKDTSLLPYSEINRQINLSEIYKMDSVIVDLIFHYWLPFEKEQQLKYGIKTFFNYVIHPEVNIATVINTLRKSKSWKTISKLSAIEPKPVYLIDSQEIVIN